MTAEVFVRRTRIEATAERVYEWHASPGALERLTPPWEPVEVVERSGGLEEGSRVKLRVGAGPARLSWVAEHRDLIEGRQFRDVQVSGPFAAWDHLHQMQPDGEACVLEDRIEYALRAGLAGRIVAGGFVRDKLERLFDYRHRVTGRDLADHRDCAPGRAAKVAVTGASGLLGSALVPFLTAGGHPVNRLVRRRPRKRQGEFRWYPEAGRVDAEGLEGVDAVIHLAGENVAAGRWTEARKARILRSRARGTRTLAESLTRLERPPKLLICASAIGYYGDRGDELLTETSGAGAGFLSEVTQEWETATAPAEEAGIRTVHLRIGVVLSPLGGALQKMLVPFRLGAGGRIGSGRQWLSWVAIDDVLGAIHHALVRDDISGPVNVVAPYPVTNTDLTKTLARVLGRPAFAAVPALAARLAMGEMADALVLSSTRVRPQRLEETEYDFRHPDLEGALRHLLGRRAS